VIFSRKRAWVAVNGGLRMGQVFLDRYEAKEAVGQGGMATVYKGIDRTLNRSVAIKVLHGHLASQPEARKRFSREATVIAKLQHPNIVEVYDVSDGTSGQAVIVTEFIDGFTLAEFLRRHGPLIPEMAAAVVQIVAEALEHAHGKGIIHRDIKPENVMVRSDGTIKLMDFGIAQVIDMEHLTVTGTVMGSPAHMSPEQIDGQRLDGRTDIFSLGTLFYVLASGQYPFLADSPAAILRLIVEGRYPDVRTVRPQFSDELNLVLRKMMARLPAERYQNVAEISAALEKGLEFLGIASPSSEVTAFFEDPVKYEPLFQAKLIEARLALCSTFLAQRQYLKAIRQANTILALEAKQPDALKVLKQARSKVRRTKTAKTALAVSLVTLIIVGILLYWPKPSPVVVDPISIRPAEQVANELDRRELVEVSWQVQPDETEKVAEKGVVSRAAKVHSGPTSSARQTAREAPKEPTSPVSIHAFPPAVRIEIDGRFVGEGRVDGIMLTPGRHQVRLTHPSCEQCKPTDHVFKVDPAKPLLAPLRLSIGYLDASVTIQGPAGGQVFVNRETQPRGVTNKEFKVPMTRPQAITIPVKVQWPSGVVKNTQIQVSPGQKVSAYVE
jgi:serine/threonine protein kinase